MYESLYVLFYRQEKEVLEDSKEAQDWLAKQKALGLPTTPSSSSLSAQSTAPAPTAPTSAIDALFSLDDSAPASGTPPVASTSTSSSTTEPPAPVVPTPAPALKPAPGPKKKKGGGLGALAASLGKPAKLNTLEKSKLDWNKCACLPLLTSFTLTDLCSSITQIC